MTPRAFLGSAALIATLAVIAVNLPGAATTIVERDKMCSDVPCFTLTARSDAIRSHNAQLTAAHRYLAIGDSITEYASLEPICGAAPVNAGISGATTNTWLERARPLADTVKPDFIVLALGTNDAWRDQISSYSNHLDALLASLKSYPVLIIPPPPSPDIKLAARFAQATAIAGDKPNAVTPLKNAVTVDGVHLTATDYAAWKIALRAKATSVICPGSRF